MGHAASSCRKSRADEVRTALAAMRFKSKGGTRPDEGIGLAAAVLGIERSSIARKILPLNRNGELVLWAIIESKKGIANALRDCRRFWSTVLTVAQVPLGGVFSSTGPDGTRVRDQAGFDSGVASVLAA